MRPSPDHDHLMALAAAADADLSAIGADGAILRLSDLVALPEAFTWFPLEGSHPLDLLLGFRAPPHWRALGVSCDGRTHRLDASGRYDDTATDSDDVTVTILVGRDGAAAGLLRRGGQVTPQPGRPQGAVADACRRALGVTTAPPPSSTLGLWTLSWLDRIVDVATRADGAARLRSWAAVAELHAATGLDGHGAVATSAPVALAASAATLAEAWPWARLRAEPAVVDVPGPQPSPALAAWMDDGMWARWLLSRLPRLDDLVAAVHALLPPVLAEGVGIVVEAARHPDGHGDTPPPGWRV
ncbi:MAG: hypothetical protein JXA83_02100 [Acidimicrobiales bacterium]|nr:hypothetical protein [Acidimicrobiales bacterium]